MKNELLIRYWGRKPPNLVRNYIEKYSRKGELILDPFGGSGSIVKTAIYLRRRAIYSDINPFAKLIAEASLIGCDCNELVRALKKLDMSEVVFITENGLRKRLQTEKFFSIKCKCGRPNVVEKIIFSRKYRAIKKTKPSNLKNISSKVFNFISRNKRGVTYEQLISYFRRYQHQVVSNAVTRLIKIGAIQEDIMPLRVSFNGRCQCGIKQIVNPQKLKWIIDEKPLPAYWFPAYRLEYPNGRSFYKKRDVERVDEFFTDRNLVFLSQLWDMISKFDGNERVKNYLYLIFFMTVVKSSKMCRESGGTWPVNSYWIPRRFVVWNPYITFKRSVAQALEAISQIRRNVKKGNVEQVLQKQADVCFLSHDATNLNLPENSIDYIVTDPPHFDEVQFLELSFFYTAWLRSRLPFEREMVVNPAQNKGIDFYLNMVEKFSSEMHRILKPNRYMTTILHEENPSLLEKCTDIIESAGFKLYEFEENSNFNFYTFRKTNKTKTRVYTGNHIFSLSRFLACIRNLFFWKNLKKGNDIF